MTPRKRRTGLFIGIGAGALVLVLVIVLGIQAIVSFVGGSGQAGGLSGLSASSRAGSTYAYTKTLENVPADHKFTIAMHFDFSKKIAQLTQERATKNKTGTPDPFTAIGVYTNPGLTVPADVTIQQYANSDDVVIRPSEEATATQVSYADSLTTPRQVRISDGKGWSLHHDYYIVRRVSPSGAKLAKPIVTHFTVAGQLAEPAVNTTVGADGKVRLTWKAVKGANRYFIVSEATSDDPSGGNSPRLLGTTTKTSWTNDVELKVDGAVQMQNAGLEATSETTDESKSEFGVDWKTHAFQFGVIATDGTRFSGWRSYDTHSMLGNLPYRFAEEAASKVFPEGNQTVSMDLMPTVFPYSSLDGVTRQTAPQIELDSIKRDEGDTWDHYFYDFNLKGQGTDLIQPFGIVFDGDLSAFKSAAADYNSRMIGSLPPSGVATFNYDIEAVVGSTYDVAHPSKVAPATDLPISATSPMVKFIAANLIAHKTVINVGAFTQRAGAPSIDNAVYEAVYQNPFVIGFAGWSYVSGDVFQVRYAYDADQTKAMQAQLRDKVQSIAATVAGQSDVAKVTALNNWIVNNARYDSPAFESLTQTGAVSADYQYSQDATGVLLDAKGVCTSYAKAFTALAHAAGLDSVVVTGTITSDGVRHAWNKVKVNGGWKDVDVTWDDSAAGNAYLLIADSAFTGVAARAQDSLWIDDAVMASYAAN